MKFTEVEITIEDKVTKERIIFDAYLQKQEPNIRIYDELEGRAVIEHLPYGSGTIEVYHNGNKLTFKQIYKVSDARS